MTGVPITSAGAAQFIVLHGAVDNWLRPAPRTPAKGDIVAKGVFLQTMVRKGTGSTLDRENRA